MAEFVFPFTNTVETVAIPAGVTEVEVEVSGAAGGDAFADWLWSSLTAQSNDSTGIVPAMSGLQAGDLVLAVSREMYSAVPSGATMAAPAGWTLLGSGPWELIGTSGVMAGYYLRSQVWMRQVSGPLSSETWGLGPAPGTYGVRNVRMIVLRPTPGNSVVVTAAPVVSGDPATGGTSTPIDLPALPTVGGHAVIVTGTYVDSIGYSNAGWMAASPGRGFMALVGEGGSAPSLSASGSARSHVAFAVASVRAKVASGGRGGRSVYTLAVTPGETLSVAVGGKGADSVLGPTRATTVAAGGAVPPTTITANGGSADSGGAGGGAGSKVAIIRGSTVHTVVGGGGGGAGATRVGSAAADGGAGGAPGVNGSPASNATGGQGGRGATGPTIPGTGGAAFGAGGLAGANGAGAATAGHGGQGNSGSSDSHLGGGGGGGGASGGGGGGGAQSAGVSAGGGGGGYSGQRGTAFVPILHETGVNPGPGEVTIRWGSSRPNGLSVGIPMNRRGLAVT